MVSVEPEMDIRFDVAASKLSTMVPVPDPERTVMVPVPRAIASEKVRTMLLPTATLVVPSAGEKVETVGAIVSDCRTKELDVTIPSEKERNSTSQSVSVPAAD